MFWRMAGLSTVSPVETILDRENFTLDELLDDDEIIQECKALNSRLINFLSGRPQVEQLIRYIVEEAPEDSEKKRTFKFPFLACEVFTCEVDTILKTLVEDEELMNLLFSFLDPTHSHSNLLAGYFSKVVICLLLRKTVPFMQYVQAHQEIMRKLVELIGITSIMEVLIRLIAPDEHMYVNHVDAMQWIEETDVLEMIVDKFSSSDSPEVHANAAETLCAITRFAPAGLSAKISSPSFVGRLFRHALEDSRPKSVLVNSLCVCISLLDPKRHTFGAYHTYNRQMTNGSTVAANPETVEGMLESLGDLLKLLDVSSAENLLLTTFGKLLPPLGKHRLKIIEFILVLVTVGSESAEKKLIDLGAVQRIIDLFFEYPYNNFLHHHVENIILSFLESKNSSLVEHLLRDCDFVGKIIQAEKHFTLEADAKKPTIPVEGKSPPRIGNIGHLTRISNKLGQLGNNNSVIQEHLQGNIDWTDWYADVLSKRNAVENVYEWACGRPTALHDRNRDSDDDDYQDRDYDVAALANNLSQAFRYGIFNNEDIEEVHGSLERDDEDVYFDDESAEVVISSLRLGDDHESGSLFTNSNWFAFEEDRDQVANEQSAASLPSPSPIAEEDEGANIANGDDDLVTGEGEDLADTAISLPEAEPKLEESGTDKPVEWVEWRESSDANGPSGVLANGELETGSGNNATNAHELSSPSSSAALTKDEQITAEPSASPSVALTKDEHIAAGPLASSSVALAKDEQSTAEPSASLTEKTIETSEPTHTGNENPSSCTSTSVAL
ncbi:PREDICTED: serine/threonine-protein phosphatase 6 regulatory subunit 3-like isoform X2 [Lupinus angustifolius]|uniref:serine/threonine-protein phosphatase 6 regulatory subunit 3-like isoform X2 n=1 Tax=Lupinus angustifolius TaxID=3871 RepID=UPI00092EB254|nr:PREDICTED: serine/threonine-protein phosphatase 6 regulatory subunit 3-like isoform X2 [Lupinus angustifolius]XP_019431261.1 PREDICTED: serine/threonine-protein phosphatase 6 regulatory subunit 3-like isoform X2 [Lupinus angustifolius]